MTTFRLSYIFASNSVLWAGHSAPFDPSTYHRIDIDTDDLDELAAAALEHAPAAYNKLLPVAESGAAGDVNLDGDTGVMVSVSKISKGRKPNGFDKRFGHSVVIPTTKFATEVAA